MKCPQIAYSIVIIVKESCFKQVQALSKKEGNPMQKIK